MYFMVISFCFQIKTRTSKFWCIVIRFITLIYQFWCDMRFSNEYKSGFVVFWSSSTKTMKQTTTFLALLLVSCLLVETMCGGNDLKKSDVKSVKKGMWFGPRLGRKKRGPVSDDFYRTTVLDKDQLENLMEALADSPLIILTTNGGKLRNFQEEFGNKWNDFDLDVDYQPSDRVLRF